MTNARDKSLTIDPQHHMLPDFFWQETENAHTLAGGHKSKFSTHEAQFMAMEVRGQGVGSTTMMNYEHTI